MIAAHEWREALGLVADFLAAWQPQATTAGLGLFLAWSWWARRRRGKALRKLREENAALKGEVYGEHAGEGARPGILRRVARVEEWHEAHPKQHDALRAGILDEIEAADTKAALVEDARDARVKRLEEKVAANDGKAALAEAALVESCENLGAGLKRLNERLDALASHDSAAALIERCERLDRRCDDLTEWFGAMQREAGSADLARDLCRAITTLAEERATRP